MTVREQIARNGGRVAMVNGQPVAVMGSDNAAAATKAVVTHYDISNPPKRPVNVRFQPVFHKKGGTNQTPITAVSQVNFFDTTPLAYGIDGNFDRQGIQLDQEIVGLRALISPQSFQDVDSTYCTVMSLWQDAGWEVLVNRNPVQTGLMIDIAPRMEWRGNGAGKFITTVEKAEFFLFRDNPTIGALDRLVVNRDDNVTVRVNLASAFTPKSGMSVGIELATRPARQAVLL